MKTLNRRKSKHPFRRTDTSAAIGIPSFSRARSREWQSRNCLFYFIVRVRRAAASTDEASRADAEHRRLPRRLCAHHQTRRITARGRRALLHKSSGRSMRNGRYFGMPLPQLTLPRTSLQAVWGREGFRTRQSIRLLVFNSLAAAHSAGGRAHQSCVRAGSGRQLQDDRRSPLSSQQGWHKPALLRGISRCRAHFCLTQCRSRKRAPFPRRARSRGRGSARRDNRARAISRSHLRTPAHGGKVGVQAVSLEGWPQGNIRRDIVVHLDCQGRETRCGWVLAANSLCPAEILQKAPAGIDSDANIWTKLISVRQSRVTAPRRILFFLVWGFDKKSLNNKKSIFFHSVILIRTLVGII